MTDSMDVSVTVTTVWPEEYALFDRRLAQTDEGRTIRIDSSDNPEFAAAIEIPANGNDDSMGLGATFPGGGGGSTGRSESALIAGGFTGDYVPDLAGAEVSHVVVHLDEVELATPGRDPNGDGNWTEYRFGLRIVFMGRP